MGLSDLFSSGSGCNGSNGSKGYQPPAQVFQSLTFMPSPNNDKATIVQREGPQGSAFPLFSMTPTSFPQSGIQVSRVVGWNPALQEAPISEVRFHSLSTTNVDMQLHGQHLKIKNDGFSSTYTMDDPRAGKLKWKSSSKALELTDSAGTMLAKYQRKGAIGRSDGKRLDILIPCDDLFLDLIVVSALAVGRKREKDSKDAEAAGEVVSALAGA